MVSRYNPMTGEGMPSTYGSYTMEWNSIANHFQNIFCVLPVGHHAWKSRQVVIASAPDKHRRTHE